MFYVAARTLFELWDCLFVYLFFSDCNIWNEYPIYLEGRSWTCFQMGKYFWWNWMENHIRNSHSFWDSLFWSCTVDLFFSMNLGGHPDRNSLCNPLHVAKLVCTVQRSRWILNILLVNCFHGFEKLWTRVWNDSWSLLGKDMEEGLPLWYVTRKPLITFAWVKRFSRHVLFMAYHFFFTLCILSCTIIGKGIPISEKIHVKINY